MSPNRIEKEGKELFSPEPWFLKESEIDLEKQEAELVKLKLENERLSLELDEERRSAGRRGIFLYILLAIFAILIPITLVVIIADGLRLFGIDIDTTTINLLAAATIAEVAGLLAIGVGWLFRDSGGKSRKE
jgi:hypothetical protein